MVGLSAIALGVLNDAVQEIALLNEVLPENILAFILFFNEEYLNTFGACFIAISACMFAGSSLFVFCKQNPLVSIMLVIAAAMIAWGNGLAHYQYKPSATLLSVAFALSLAGVVLLLFLRRTLALGARGPQLYEAKEYRFDAFWVFFFLLMPIFLHDYNYSISTVLWCWLVYVARANYRRAIVRF